MVIEYRLCGNHCAVCEETVKSRCLPPGSPPACVWRDSCGGGGGGSCSGSCFHKRCGALGKEETQPLVKACSGGSV